MNTLLRVGLIGLCINLVLNLFGLFVLAQPAARFFSDEWWSVWFPTFVVWVVLTIVGLGRLRADRRTARRA